jgi:hypothetical protein
MKTLAILLTVGVYTVALVVVVVRLIQARRSLAEARSQIIGERIRHVAEVAVERDRRVESEDQTFALVDKVYPLIEKTSWNTYWTAGNAHRALAEEATRNRNVDAARKALWNIPLVATYIRDLYEENNK